MSQKAKSTTHRLLGLPGCLQPEKIEGSFDKFEIVKDGPRNLTARPFDFRNPFALLSLEQIRNEFVHDPDTRVCDWPIENEQPDKFDYYCSDNAALGLPGGPETALVDIFGNLRAFTGAWAFALGPHAQRPHLRIRELFEGDKPIILAETTVDDTRYEFEYFAAEIPQAPECDYFIEAQPREPGNDYPGTQHHGVQWVGPLRPKGRNIYLCVRVSAVNEADETKSSVVHLGFSQQYALPSGGFFESPPVAPEWRNVRLTPIQNGLFRLSAKTTDRYYTLAILRTAGVRLTKSNSTIDHWPTPIRRVHEKRTAACFAKVIRKLSPGEKMTLEWLIPHFPFPAQAEHYLLNQTHDKLKNHTVQIWTQRRRETLNIEIPELKVQQAYHQAINHLDLCSVRLGESEYPTPGASGGYHHFYQRDSLDMIYAYDILGETSRAERMIDHYRHFVINQESAGMFLWLVGKHHRLTKDNAWLERILPEVKRRMTWLMSFWLNHRGANDGLLADFRHGDNECVKGHFVSYHLYAVAGIKAAVEMARALGQQQLAQWWVEFDEEFTGVILERLGKLIQQTGGVITPSFEGYNAELVFVQSGSYGKKGGIDWHNIGLVFPTELFPPHHPWVTSSLQRWRHCYLEGSFSYAHNGYENIHNYNGINLSETFLRRGDYAETLRDLYGLLLHTSASHGSAEVVNTRERYDHNCVPHNWFSGKFIRFLRDCLVYEGHDQRLHLLGCLAAAWMSPGMILALTDARTELGVVSLHAKMRTDGMDLKIKFTPCPGISEMVLHLPEFLKKVTVEADGKALRPRKTGWLLPNTTTTVRVSWKPGDIPDISFEKIAAAYIEDYRRRAAKLKKTNKLHPIART